MNPIMVTDYSGVSRDRAACVTLTHGPYAGEWAPGDSWKFTEGRWQYKPMLPAPESVTHPPGFVRFVSAEIDKYAFSSVLEELREWYEYHDHVIDLTWAEGGPRAVRNLLVKESINDPTWWALYEAEAGCVM